MFFSKLHYLYSSSKLLRASGTLFIGGTFAGILGYGFQVVMGRLLQPQEYGLFNAVMSLFVIFSAPLGTLMLLVTRKVSAYRTQGEMGSIRHLFYSLNLKIVGAGILLFGAFYFFAPDIQGYLKSPNLIVVYLFGLLIFLNFPMSVNNAFLQGKQRFIWYAITTNLSVLIKLALATTFVLLGYGVEGAIGGVAGSFIALWLISYGVMRPFLEKARLAPFKSSHFSIGGIFPVLIANLTFAIMTQMDMVLVNYFFSSKESGLYASASVLGKAVMYLSGGIVIALFPLVVEKHTLKEKNSHLLVQAVGLTLALCGFGALFYFFFGEQIIALLYGQDYQRAGVVLKFYGLIMIPMALILVAENYLIATGKVLFAYLFLALIPFQLAAIYFYHDSLLQVITVMGLFGCIQAIIGYVLLWKAFQK